MQLGIGIPQNLAAVCAASPNNCAIWSTAFTDNSLLALIGKMLFTTKAWHWLCDKGVVMISSADMKKLATIEGPCLSVFQPLRDIFSQVTKTDTRLEAAVQRAEGLLANRGFDEAARERFLQPIYQFIKNTNWTGRTGSVIVFRSPGFFKASFWPDALEPRVDLADEFFILPLLARLGRPCDYWILALSINRIRLFRGALQSLSEIELPQQLPRSLADAGGFDQPDHDLESRSSPGASTGQTAAVRFGTSSLHESKGRHLHDFFKMIDRAILPILGRTGDPLILAAVPRELAIYREVNTYSALFDEAIHGNPDALGEHRLHQMALELMAASSPVAADQFRYEAEAAAGKGLLLRNLPAIHHAARMGQIERLFVNSGSRVDEGLTNSTTLAVFRNSGTVVYDAFPSTTEGIAAILRYRASEATEPELAANQTPA